MTGFKINNSNMGGDILSVHIKAHKIVVTDRPAAINIEYFLIHKSSLVESHQIIIIVVLWPF